MSLYVVVYILSLIVTVIGTEVYRRETNSTIKNFYLHLTSLIIVCPVMNTVLAVSTISEFYWYMWSKIRYK